MENSYTITSLIYLSLLYLFQFYKVAVKVNGEWLNEGPIFRQLESIVSAPIDTLAEPVGILTSQTRETWAAIRQIMQSGDFKTACFISNRVFELSVWHYF